MIQTSNLGPKYVYWEREREREQPQKRMQRDSFITATLNKKGKRKSH